MRSKKHVLEFFKKDPWPIRVCVLVIQSIKQVAICAMVGGGLAAAITKWPHWLSSLAGG